MDTIVKKISAFVVFVVIVGLLFSSCAKKADESADGTASTADVSYAFGLVIGSSLKDTTLEIDTAAFMRGMKDMLDKGEGSLSLEEANMRIQAAINVAQKARSEGAVEAEKAYLEGNAKQPGVVTTESGLQYQILSLGNGPKPVVTDVVKVDYSGTLTDGTMFDSSIVRGEPAVFQLGQVIPGWIEGLQLMPVGSQFRFFIPSDLAYGPQGAGDAIPPYAPLIFDVTLISIEPPVAAPAP